MGMRVVEEVVERHRRRPAEEASRMMDRAEQLLRGGASQRNVCHQLGISVMTYHRWRKKALPAEQSARDASALALKEAQLENARLRRIASDLLIELQCSREALHSELQRRGGRLFIAKC